MMPLLTGSRQRGAIFALTSAMAFLIYLRTLAPGVLPGDSGEFQFAAWGWTLAHPTGYPLYLLVGGIWQHLVPFGDPAFRLNLLSAVISAFTVGLSYDIFFHSARSRGVALVAAMTFAVAPTFWSQATESEVYALNTFFVVLLTWLALKWQPHPNFNYADVWALVFGLALTHHRSVILLLPGFAVFFMAEVYLRVGDNKTWRDRLHAQWLRRALIYAALIALPLLLYLYIPLRASASSYRTLRVSPAHTIVTIDNTPEGWLAYASGRSFEFELAFNAASFGSLQGLPQRLLSEFNILGVVLGLIGLFVLCYQRRLSLAGLTLLSIAAIVSFNVSYHIGDIADFYTPVYFFFAIWIAVAVGAIQEYLSEHTQLRGSLLPSIFLLLAAAALPVQNFFASFVEQDRSLHTEWRDRWKAILQSDLPPNAILISNDRDEMTPMWYMQIVEGKRPDALGLFPLISPDSAYSNVMRLTDSVIDSGRPVFVIKTLPDLALRYRLDSVPGGLFRVADATLPAPTFKSGALVGEKLRVIGYSIVSGVVQPDRQFTIAVYWQPLQALGRDYSTSLQVFDDAGQKVAQGGDHRPGGDTYPSSKWQSGETLYDLFAVTMQPDVVPGAYRLFVKVYDPVSDESLGELTEIGTLEVSE
jgi:hypothetical protein